MAINEKILETAKKIMALRDKAGTEAEAAAAAAMLQKLLLKHQLSMVDVENFKEAKKFTVVKDYYDDGYTTLPDWCKVLVSKIAEGFDCMVVLSHAYDTTGIGNAVRTRIFFVGDEHDVLVAKLLYKRLADYLIDVADQRAQARCIRGRDKTRYKSSFVMGAAMVIKQRLQDERTQLKKIEPKIGGLIVLKNQEVAQAFKAFFPQVRKGRPTISKSDIGMMDGRIEGQNVSLSQGIGKSEGQKALES